MRLFRDERGSETVEFAFVLPIIVFVVFALLFGLTATAAQVSLAHSASVAARFASIPTDAVSNVYPTSAEVAQRAYDATPFFDPSRCTTAVSGAATQNAAVTVTLACSFPNPFGRVMDRMTSIFDNSSPNRWGSSDDLAMSATGKARRE